MYLCNRVVRCSKAQHTSEFALSLNRYHKIETLLFYSDTQLDTVFLTILCKDTNKSSAKANLFDFAEREYLRRSAKDTNKSSAKATKSAVLSVGA